MNVYHSCTHSLSVVEVVRHDVLHARLSLLVSDSCRHLFDCSLDGGIIDGW